MTTTNEQTESTLPDGWIWATLGDITQPIAKANPRETPDTLFTYLDISGIDNTTYQIKDPRQIYGMNAPSRARQPVQVNDVLFSTVRPYLKNIAIVPDEFDGAIASTGFAVLRGEAGISARYLFYYCLTDEFLAGISELQRGTSYPAVRDSDVLSQSIPLPPSVEQERIVAAIEQQFSRLDKAVATIQRTRTRLARYKATTLEAACQGQLVPQDPDDEPAELLLERILAERRRKWEEEVWAKVVDRARQKAARAIRKAAGNPLQRGEKLAPEEWQDLDEAAYGRYLPKNDNWKQKYPEPAQPNVAGLTILPEGWVWVTYEQLGEWCGGGTPSKQTSMFWDGGTIPWVSPKDMKSTWIENTEDKITELGLHNSSTKLIPSNSILFVVRSSVLQRVLPIGLTLVDVAINQDVRALIPSDLVDPKYLLFCTQGLSEDIRLLSLKGGTTVESIDTIELQRYTIPLPPLNEQHRIVEEVERQLILADNLEKAVNTSLVHTEQLRQAVLRQAYAGELVSQNPDDEPADQLIERIQTIRAEREELAKQQKRSSKGKGGKVAKKKEKRGLYETLAAASKQLTPNELFTQAGFAADAIDAFYEELRQEVDKQRIIQHRPNTTDVYLRAAKDAN